MRCNKCDKVQVIPCQDMLDVEHGEISGLMSEDCNCWKNKYNLVIMAVDDFYLIAAITVIAEKVAKVWKNTVSENIANVF